MPIYEYKCGVCKKITEDLRGFDECNLPCLCQYCGCVAEKTVSTVNIRTDTNFWYTGKYDERLGCVVEGRKHWKDTLKLKGLREVDDREGWATTTTTEERVKKHGLDKELMKAMSKD